VEAQTISNLYLALGHDLEIIPVLNKIDLPGADPEVAADEVIDLLGCKREDIVLASGKEGIGIEDILAKVIENIPPPKGDPEAPLQAMIFDSQFNSFRGVEVIFRIFNGTLKKGDRIKFVNTGKEYFADEIGILGINQIPQQTMSAGNVGYLISGIKVAKEVAVGDTVTHVKNPCAEAIKGFENVKPMVFAGIYPVDTTEFEELRASMEKLQLNGVGA
jgi:GTP-binding protein LepA